MCRALREAGPAGRTQCAAEGMVWPPGAGVSDGDSPFSRSPSGEGSRGGSGYSLRREDGDLCLVCTRTGSDRPARPTSL